MIFDDWRSSMGENFFDVIFYSFYIFEGNYKDFKSTVHKFIKLAGSDEFLDSQKSIELHIYGGRELARLIHNYAASWLSLVDHTRIIQTKIKSSKLKHLKEFSLEYEKRLSESLRDSFENRFIKDLRRYVQHKAVPVPTLQYRLAQTEHTQSFEFNSKDIQDFDWYSKVKDYIQNRRTVPIEKIIDQHFKTMKDFYLWVQFRDQQLHPYSSIEIQQMTFEDWKNNISMSD
jgi:hypothetical protein